MRSPATYTSLSVWMARSPLTPISPTKAVVTTVSDAAVLLLVSAMAESTANAAMRAIADEPAAMAGGGDRRDLGAQVSIS